MSRECDNCGCELVSFHKEVDDDSGHYEYVKSKDGSGRRYCSKSCRKEAEE